MNPESECLRKWKVDSSLPTNFNSVVWRRIEDHRPVSVAEAIRGWINEIFARKAVAVAYLSLALIFGLAAAHVQASKVIRERESQLQGRYLNSVDPYVPGSTR